MMTHDYIEHQFCKYMVVQKMVTRRDIDMETTCREMGVTPQELTEYLRYKLSTTFNEAVHAYRIEEAKELLEKSEMTPICEIAHAVGYDNSVAFLLHFFKHEHCLPHVWKIETLILI